VRILGIDPSLTATGLALIDDGNWTWGTTLRPGERRGGDRLWWLGQGVSNAVAGSLGADGIVAMEGYSFGSSYQRETLGELGGVLRALLWGLHIPVVVLPPSAWRRQLLGPGWHHRLEGLDHKFHKAAIGPELSRLWPLQLDGTHPDSLDSLEAWAVAFAVWQRIHGLYVPPLAKQKRKVRKGDRVEDLPSK